MIRFVSKKVKFHYNFSIKKMKEIDERFVGTWKGTDEGRLEEFAVNHWVISRTIKGEFFVEFKSVYLDGSVEHFSEKGIWYVKNNRYYGQRDSEETTDGYLFKILSDKAIHFQDLESDYYFTDHKMLLN